MKNNDPAHEFTDEQIALVEKRLIEIYSKANADIEKKIINQAKTIANLPTDATLNEVMAEWNKSKKLELLKEQMVDVLSNTNAEAVRILNGTWANVYDENFSYIAFLLEQESTGTVIPLLGKSAIDKVVSGEISPFTLLSIDEKLDRAVIERELTNALLSGISAGESIDDIASRIESTISKVASSFKTVAQTETNRIQNAARFDSANYGKELGLDLEKEWVATGGSRTRKTHAKADGQTVDIDDNFKVGKGEGQYPGDIGVKAEDIGCRCTHLIHVKNEKRYTRTKHTESDFANWKKEKAKEK